MASKRGESAPFETNEVTENKQNGQSKTGQIRPVLRAAGENGPAPAFAPEPDAQTRAPQGLPVITVTRWLAGADAGRMGEAVESIQEWRVSDREEKSMKL